MRVEIMLASALIVCTFTTHGLACEASPSPRAAAGHSSPAVADCRPTDSPQEVPDELPIARDLRLSRFFNRLGDSFVALGDAENLRPALVAAGGAGVAALFDDEVNARVTTQPRLVRELGDVGAVVGNAAVLGSTFGGLLITGHLSGQTEMYSTGQSLLQGLILTETVVQLTKRAVGRERPDGSNTHSFPSGHTADMIMTATIAGNRLGKKVGVPLAVVATAVAASRIEKNVHWLSDVAAGAGIGYIVGRSVLRANSRYVQTRRVEWVPVVHPGGGGLSVRW